MRVALDPLTRYIGLGRAGKRMLLAWQRPEACPSDLIIAFAFADYSMGILLSRTHDAWAWAQSSTLKGDLRYAPTTVVRHFRVARPRDRRGVRAGRGRGIRSVCASQ